MSTHRLFAAPECHSTHNSFSVSIATGAHEIRETLRLRHQVFVKEMHANLRPCVNDIEEDDFDQHCRHIMVRDNATGEVVGSTRLLLQDDVGMAGMFFTESEFDIGRILTLPGRFMEAGRHCIHADYRNGEVQRLLWSATAQEMRAHDIDYLLACANLPMARDGTCANALLAQLPARDFTPKHLRAIPRLPLSPLDAALFLPLPQPASLTAYLHMGALVCGDACWDPVFDCADILMLVHRAQTAPRHVQHGLAARQVMASAACGAR